MRTLVPIVLMILGSAVWVSAQSTIPAAVPVKPGTQPRQRGRSTAAAAVEPGTVSGRTYTNKTFGFEVTFPDSWLIPDKDFEDAMKKQGFDLSLKTPDWLPPVSRAMVEKATQNVTMLLTAYQKMPGSPDNSVVRISAENLTVNPQIHDAVDYIDAIRGAYSRMKLPADFKYSETQAEKLGSMEFGYMDVTTAAEKKRMYVTVRGGYALMFMISYTDPAALGTLREVLTQGDFHLNA